MFYSEEDIKLMGYDSIDKFIEEMSKKYQGCSFRHVSNGIFFHYDYDTTPAMDNDGYCKDV